MLEIKRIRNRLELGEREYLDKEIETKKKDSATISIAALFTIAMNKNK